jgi:triosephosphate isomerase
MNKTFEEANGLINEIAKAIENKEFKNKEIVICPPSLYTEMATDFAEEFNFFVGVQNISEHKSGAYTGEISAEMVRSLEVSYAIVGHSERRMYHGETDEIIGKKVNLALDNNIRPIYCCGEQLEARKAGQHKDVVKSQIEEALFHLSKDEISNVVIAYEPVWAIGTGETATPEQAQEMHEFIRKLISIQYNQEIADEISILYGGSVKPDNAHELFIQPDVDGGLIGGASLKSDDFLAIIDAMKDE